MPLTDMFWGDRFGQVEDPYGHRWGLASHKEDVAPDEMARRQREFFASMRKP
jgi:PhnB protein